MNGKKGKISVKVSMYIAVMQVIVMVCMFLFISFSVSDTMKKSTIDNIHRQSKAYRGLYTFIRGISYGIQQGRRNKKPVVESKR